MLKESKVQILTQRKRHDHVSMEKLKLIAKKMLPKRSTLRRMVLSEPDHIPKDEAAIKIRIFAKLLHDELAREN